MTRRFTYLLLLVCTVLPMARGAGLRMEGAFSWRVRPPHCLFRVDGAIQNDVGSPYLGPLKLVLWASSSPFPARGTLVSEVELGPLAPGYQMSRFSRRGTFGGLPRIPGNYHLSLYVAELTSAGWYTRAFQQGFQRKIEGGYFIEELPWTMPARPVKAPRRKFLKDEVIRFRTVAANSGALISGDMRTTARHTFSSETKILEKGVFGEREAVITRQPLRAQYLGRTVRSLLYRVKYRATGGMMPRETSYTMFFFTPRNGVYRATTTDALGDVGTWGTFAITSPPR